MAKKQKSGLYRTKIKIGVGPDGKDINKWVSGRTRAELEDAKRAAMEKYVLGKTMAGDRMFGDYAIAWFDGIKRPSVSASSAANYRTALNKDILPVFGDRQIRAISASDLQLFLAQFAGMSQTKITVVYAALYGIFEAACADRILDANPMDHVRKPSASPAEEKRALTADERTRIEYVCLTHPWGHYLALMYYLGVRPGEARGVQWGDVDWDAGTIHIQRDIDYHAGKQAGALKTRQADRVIPMPEPLRNILRLRRGMPNAYIAQAEKGGALSKTSAERIWIELMIECGMARENEDPKSTDLRAMYSTEITPHMMRHNYATMCWEHGLDAYTAKQLLGHASVKTTMDIYTHLSNAQIAKVSEKLDGIFKNKLHKSCTDQGSH